MRTVTGSRVLWLWCLKKYPLPWHKQVTALALQIPTIGIGAGKHCDGQVLVMHDMLGINTEFKPRFLRQYLNLQRANNQRRTAVHH